MSRCVRFVCVSFVLFAACSHPDVSRHGATAVGIVQRQWTHETIGWVGAVAADTTRVAIVSGNHRVTLLDANTGRARWEVGGLDVENDTPALTSDAVIAPTATGFIVLSARDGATQWRLTGAVSPGHVAVGNGALSFATDDGVLATWRDAVPFDGASLDAAHAPLWQVRFAGAVRAAPVFADTANTVAATWSEQDRKSTRLNSSHNRESRMPSSA